MAICNICGCDTFLPFGKREKALCKNCASLERHRAMHGVLTRREGFLDKLSSARILHLAPENCIAQWLQDTGRTYIAADIRPEIYPQIKCLKLQLPDGLDIFPEGYFDLIVHNHILEHIPGDYRLHILSFLRLVAPGGMMAFTVPVFRDKKTRQFGELLSSDEERYKFFGQKDHNKIFGDDFIQFFEQLRYKFEILELSREAREASNAFDRVYIVSNIFCSITN